MRGARSTSVVAGASALLLAAAAALAADAEPVIQHEVVIKAGRIAPVRIEVPAGRKLRLALRNEGPGPAEFENLDLRIEKVLAPGAASFVVIHPLRPGSYRFVDEFHPETAAMVIVAK
ncbi:cupredoxin domain-containing protein [Piscinibacter sp.]|uniref:cupredoxin domain-containing protein n=1 Tax=Piscinibacter sp. TaxID=1903157 RepID=UPI0035B12C5F